MADIVRDVFLAFVRVHLLHHASEQPIYGLAMIEELSRHGYRLSPGTLYPIFRGLEDAGFLRSEPVVVEGKVRKYYRITAAGRRALEEFKAKIRELVGEALYGAEPPAAKDRKRKTAPR
jgi:PadR family transcriptional regulator PadR